MIELLAVVTMVLVLLAFLLPTFRSIRSRGERTACINNERQILAAMFVYAADYGGSLPQQGQFTLPYTDWSARLTNYLGGTWDASNPNSRCVFTCPGDLNERITGPTQYIGKVYWRSYAVNGTNAWSVGFRVPWPSVEERPERLASIPLHVILIGENHGIDGATGPGVTGAYVEVSEMESMQGYASAQHRENAPMGVASTDNPNGGGNYGYPDGRVEYHPYVDFQNPNLAFDGGPNDPWKWK